MEQVRQFTRISRESQPTRRSVDKDLVHRESALSGKCSSSVKVTSPLVVVAIVFLLQLYALCTGLQSGQPMRPAAAAPDDNRGKPLFLGEYIVVVFGILTTTLAHFQLLVRMPSRNLLRDPLPAMGA